MQSSMCDSRQQQSPPDLGNFYSSQVPVDSPSEPH